MDPVVAGVPGPGAGEAENPAERIDGGLPEGDPVALRPYAQADDEIERLVGVGRVVAPDLSETDCFQAEPSALTVVTADAKLQPVPGLGGGAGRAEPTRIELSASRTQRAL